jgi:protein ImuB
MARIACLWVPELPLAATLRVEPELEDLPLAITDGRSPRSSVVALSPAALAAGLAPGMTAAQAHAACDALIVRPLSAEALRAAVSALADVARTVGPRVEVDGEGTVYLDCTGSTVLCASEAELATVIGARAERQGLTARVGLADTKHVARIAARAGGGVRIVPPGAARVYLAPLPVALLDPEEGIATTLASWGIRRIGELAALSSGSLAHRLGSAGDRLARLARGEDDEPLRCEPPPPTFTEGLELDHGIEHIEPLLFLLHRLLDRLVTRLAMHEALCEVIELRLALESGGRVAYSVTPAAPTREVETLLGLLRSQVDREPPSHAITGVTVVGVPGRIRPIQLDFFEPTGPSPIMLAATLAHLAVLCGPESVGSLGCARSHRPGAGVLSPFMGSAAVVPGEGSSASHRAARGTGSRAPRPDGMPWAEAGGFPEPASTASGAPASPLERGSPSVVRVALRAFRPPVPLEVFESAGRPDYVRGRGFGGRVVHLAGPWRLRGEWWTADPLAREYYDVQLSDGGVYRVYRGGRTGRWFADGAYD